MEKRNLFQEALQTRKHLVLDGAFATELERFGCNLKDPLWSAKALIEAPHLVKKVHLSYLAVGADIVESSGYQATVEGFESKGFSTEEAKELVKLSVSTAIDARNTFIAAKKAGATIVEGFPIQENNALSYPLVAASVGPFGAFLADGSEYRGAYGKTIDELAHFHRSRLALFAAVEPDVFACETIPCLDEAKALAIVLSEGEVTKGIPSWVSFSCQDEEHICSGESIGDCAAYLDTVEAVQAIGINCTQPKYVESLIHHIREHTAKPIVVYPNTGELYNIKARAWYGEVEAFDTFARTWAKAGASIIGGCCRIGPAHIESLASWMHEV